MDIAVLADYSVKMKRSENLDKYSDLTREQKIGVEHVSESDTSKRCCSWNSIQGLGKETGRTGNERNNLDYTDHSLVW